MYKTIVRFPVAGISLRAKAPRLAVSFSTTSHHSNSRSALQKCLKPTFSTSIRAYSTSEGKQKSSEPDSEAGITPDAWVSILENTVSSPWLPIRPQAHERILERAFTLILQIILSLNVPRDPEAAQAFFFAFEKAPVSADSEIGRGRRAVATLARYIIDDISAIPDSSPLRKEHPKIFALHGALVPLADMYLRDPSGNVEEWPAFWARAESPLLELNGELHSSGFGMDLEELLEAKKNEEGNKQS